MTLKEIGQSLKQTREKQGKELSDAANYLKIRETYLCAIEDGDVEAIDATIYLTGYVRGYAGWLGMNAEEVVHKFKQELGSDKTTALPYANNNSRRLFIPFKLNIHKVPRLYIVVALLSSILLYTAWYVSVKWNELNVSSLFYDAESVPSTSTENVSTVIVETAEEINTLAPNDYVLMALSDATITLTSQETSEVLTEKTLSAGEIFFYSNAAPVTIQSTSPVDVEIYLNDDKGTFLGTVGNVQSEE